MSAEQNKAIARRFIEEVWNNQNLTAIDELYAPNAIEHRDLPPFELDRESAKQYTAPLFSAFPDVHVTIEDMVAEGNTVVTRWTAHGTHQGELMGIAPTGKTIAVMGISIGRHDANGQLVESWTTWDRLTMLQQLDIILVPERAREVGG
jgi:steroid delta-isomerase-like uncharacterized protein